MKKLILLLFIVSFVFFSCESNTYDSITSKETAPTFQRDIQPIINANCIVCHYENSSAAPFSLISYDQVRNKTEFGSLIFRIETATGELSMPRNQQKLGSTQIELIKAWAKQGYKN